MKILRVIWPALCVAFAAAAAAQDAPVQGRPKIHFQAPIHDFGQAQNGKSVRHDFVVTNTGDAPLEIKTVKPTCGCTLAGDWPKRLLPGESGKIPIQLKTDNFRGPITKSVRVESNDPDTRVATLQIKGRVWTPIDFPASVPLKTQSSRDSSASKTVKITNNTKDPLTLTDVRSTNPKFKAEIKTLKHGHEFELTITALPPLNYGSNRSNIAITTSNPDMSQLNLMTYVSVTQPVDVIPKSLSLAAGELKRPLSKYLTVRNRTGEELTLDQSAIDIDGVGVTLERRNNGRYYRYKLTFPAGYVVPKDLNAHFTFRTDNTEFPKFSIPVRTIRQRTATAKPASR